MNHIDVCICTFRRPHLLRRLLRELDLQVTKGLFTFSMVIVDNDSARSAEPVVATFARESSVRTGYFLEPEQSIALARNKAVANARGDFIAFIDDDEYPERDWLVRLFETCERYGSGGVLGPVKPHFEQEPPSWVTRGKFFDRPMHETGHRIGQSDARTGNVILRHEIFKGVGGIFGTEFATGGEDVDFFRRMMDRGYVFLWCNEAVVYEIVPPARCTRSYLLRRALLRGGNSFKQRSDRTRKVLKSLVALPAYSVALPFLYMAGDHHFMKYLIKLCDHVGRLLGFAGLNLVTERDP